MPVEQSEDEDLNRPDDRLEVVQQVDPHHLRRTESSYFIYLWYLGLI